MSGAVGNVTRDPCVVPRPNSAGVKFNPAIYMPIFGAPVEISAVSAATDKIKGLVEEEKADTSSNILRTPQLIHYIELRKGFYEAGQKRSLLTIALAVVCIVAFPHSLVIGVIAGVSGAISFLAFIGTRSIIAVHQKLMDDLKDKKTFGDEVLKALKISR